MTLWVLWLFAQSGWWPIHLAPGVTLRMEAQMEYDDNLFRYSPEDLRDFGAGRKPDRFPHRTRDDLHTAVGLTLTRSWQKGNFLRFVLRSHTYALNPQKSYTFYRVTGQLRKKRLRLGLYGYLIPAYLVRYFPELDSSPVRWRPAYYRSAALGIYTRWQIGEGMSIRLEGRGKWQDYVPQFDEYDTRALWGQLKFSGEQFFLALGGERAWAKATDEPGEEPLTSDDPDYSYLAYEGEIGVGVGEKPRVALRLYGRIRWFTTPKPYTRDPYHAGRTDRDFHLILRGEIPLNRRLSLLVRYRMEIRRTSSPALPRIFEVKNYRRNRLLLGFRALL